MNCPLTHLVVNFLAFDDRKPFLNASITPILIDKQFTHLEMTCTTMVPHMITDLLEFLPNLRVLAVSYLKFSVPPLLTLANRISGNSIEKVKIEKVNQLDELEFFTTLCPGMNYFEMGIGNSIKIESVLQMLLNKRSEQNVCLSSLCFNVPEASAKLVQNLQTMIDRNNLRGDCSIKQQGNQIFLAF